MNFTRTVSELIDRLADYNTNTADAYIDRLYSYLMAWQRVGSRESKKNLKSLIRDVKNYLG